jgi:hypothetical protein
MTNRPISITVLSWLCIVFGVGGYHNNLQLFWLGPSPSLIFDSNPFGMIIHVLDPNAWPISLYPHHWYSDMHPLAMWLFPAQWIFLAVCGVLMLCGFNWVRWMLVAWVGYHFFQSLAHTRFELMFEVFYYVHSPWEAWVHAHVYITILGIMSTPSANRYFRVVQAAAANPPLR